MEIRIKIGCHGNTGKRCGGDSRVVLTRRCLWTRSSSLIMEPSQSNSARKKVQLKKRSDSTVADSAKSGSISNDPGTKRTSQIKVLARRSKTESLGQLEGKEGQPNKIDAEAAKNAEQKAESSTLGADTVSTVSPSSRSADFSDPTVNGSMIATDTEKAGESSVFVKEPNLLESSQKSRQEMEGDTGKETDQAGAEVGPGVMGQEGERSELTTVGSDYSEVLLTSEDEAGESAKQQGGQEVSEVKGKGLDIQDKSDLGSIPASSVLEERVGVGEVSGAPSKVDGDVESSEDDTASNVSSNIDVAASGIKENEGTAGTNSKNGDALVEQGDTMGGRMASESEDEKIKKAEEDRKEQARKDEEDRKLQELKEAEEKEKQALIEAEERAKQALKDEEDKKERARIEAEERERQALKDEEDRKMQALKEAEEREKQALIEAEERAKQALKDEEDKKERARIEAEERERQALKDEEDIKERARIEAEERKKKELKEEEDKKERERIEAEERKKQALKDEEDRKERARKEEDRKKKSEESKGPMNGKGKVEIPIVLERSKPSENFIGSDRKNFVRPGIFVLKEKEDDGYDVRFAIPAKIFAFNLGAKVTGRFTILAAELAAMRASKKIGDTGTHHTSFSTRKEGSIRTLRDASTNTDVAHQGNVPVDNYKQYQSSPEGVADPQAVAWQGNSSEYYSNLGNDDSKGPDATQ